MLMLPPSVRIFLFSCPTDMRKGHDGLAAIVRQHLPVGLFSGHLFVFVSRRADRAKILCFSRGGLVLWYKRLEKGRFVLPQHSSAATSVELDAGQLSMLLDGIDVSKVKRPRFWAPNKANPMAEAPGSFQLSAPS